MLLARCNFLGIVLFLIFGNIAIGQSQNTYSNEMKYLRQLLKNDSVAKAEKELHKQLLQLQSQKQYDSLVNYIFITGEIELIKGNKVNPEKSSLELVSFIEKHTKNPKILHSTYHELATLYNEFGKVQKAFEYTEKSKTYAGNNAQNLVAADYSLANYALNLGNIGLVKKHIYAAEKILDTTEIKSVDLMAQVHNLMGGTMYYTAKYDSAAYYYEKALKMVDRMEKNSENQLYFPAMIKANIVLIKQDQGKYDEALKIAQETIALNHKFLTTEKNHRLAIRVNKNLNIAYYNLSSIYSDMGNFDMADKISEFSYAHAKQNFPVGTEEYFYALLQNAETKIPKRQYDLAIAYIDKAKLSLEKMPGDNLLWNAKINSVYADAYYQKKAYKKAKEYYELSDWFSEKANPGAYVRDRLYTTINLVEVYANLNEKEKMKTLLDKAYTYYASSKGEKNDLMNDLILTQAKTALKTKEYQECIRWSDTLISQIKKDKIQGNIFTDKHEAIVHTLRAKALYELEENKDSVFLKTLVKSLDASIAALNAQKSIITSVEGVNTLIENNLELFNFSKKINLELFQKTKNTAYLDAVMELHEASLYNRIRARLNINTSTSFSGMPLELLAKENTLKKELEAAVKNKNTTNIQELIAIGNSWQSFLDSLQVQHPKYFNMRYASLEKSLDQLQDNIPEDTTVIRYLFIENQLYAFVVNHNSKELFPLHFDTVKAYISMIGEDQFKVEEVNTKLYELYLALWKPFETKITTNKVIIIPDGALFNLSFETLTAKKITSFKELSTESLLAKHTISYNYSLLLLDETRKTIDYSNSFVAFAPEFTDEMKNDYKILITDSITLDKTYLSLLSQPFSVHLVEEYSKVFDGSSFINEKASKQLFTNHAKEHKIIHIGTHAESNNVSPELSRLIFAKDASDSISINDNSLYAYEIYNQNLSSNLAILTACETGKPTYQAGEGMISLAHAFNYAGSESILTSLWKIDEQSSTQIIKSFYDNIAKGMAKDEALHDAKLKYLSEAEGRTLSPQYWAGLVIIGDVSPIAISNSNSWWLWLLGAFLLIGFFSLRRKRQYRT